MRFQHIAEQIYGRPWLITPGAHASIRRLFEARLARPRPKAEEEEDDNFWGFRRREACIDENGIGHVHILGVIGHRLSGLEKSCGATDVEEIRCEIEKLVKQGARALLLDVDSPGGAVTGVPELADFIAEVDTLIPVYGFVDQQACSAGYWLLSAARAIGVTPSAEVGSIGVYIPWVDASGQWEKAGIEAAPIVNAEGIYKATGFGPSLSDDQRSQLQSQVDRIFGLFKGFVSAHRALAGATVPDDSARGQTFLGLDSVAAGLADVVADREDFLAALVEEMNAPVEPAAGE